MKPRGATEIQMEMLQKYVAKDILDQFQICTSIPGKVPLDPNTMELVEGNEEQIRQVFKNIQAVCKASGVSLDDIVKLNVYLSDLSVFAKVNDVMKEIFSEPYPARAAIQVAKLPLDSLIEVEGIIVKK